MREKGRLLFILLQAVTRRKDLKLDDISVLRFRVWPWDCVVSAMGNDRYHIFMDYGRMDLVLRLGWGKFFLTERWVPHVRGTEIRFRSPLRLFDAFELHTRVIFWDQRQVWMEHRFIKSGRVVSIGVSRNVVTRRKTPVFLKEVFSAIGVPFTRPTKADIDFSYIEDVKA